MYLKSQEKRQASGKIGTWLTKFDGGWASDSLVRRPLNDPSVAWPINR